VRETQSRRRIAPRRKTAFAFGGQLGSSFPECATTTRGSGAPRRSLQDWLECDRLGREDVSWTWRSGSGCSAWRARRLGATVPVRSISIPQSGWLLHGGAETSRYFENDQAMERERRLGRSTRGSSARSGGTTSSIRGGCCTTRGSMWDQGSRTSHRSSATGGRLFIAIYNDQGTGSRVWLAIKRVYNKLPGFLKTPYAAAVDGPSRAAGSGDGDTSGAAGEYSGTSRTTPTAARAG
jgi:hypothetical protein